ncbi:MAG TPA: GAF domain-containing protein [Pyrinomonadaceae bacterium]|nr:GAF domain-containing protein [Pyrinomonadaceae bacterium]
MAPKSAKKTRTVKAARPAKTKKESAVTPRPARNRDDASPADQIRDVVDTFETAHTLTSPLLDSIESLLRLSAHAVGSDEASVITRDGKRGGLKFLVALGYFAPHLKKMRIPPGKGVAGFVFTTGQPLAVADVSQEESFYSAVDQQTGHSTRTMLATPLRLGEETIGVLEFVNRSGPQPFDPFTPEEMDRAATFADTIALLVDAHEKADLLESLLAFGLKQTGHRPPQKIDWHQWLNRLRAAPEHKELLSLALALRDIASQGEDERKLCRDMLAALSQWTRKRSVAEQIYRT